MRILQISDFYPPHRGGLEQHVRSLSHQLALRGHDVFVATLGGLAPGQAADDDGIPLATVPGLPSVIPPLNKEREHRYPLPAHDPLARRSLERLIERVRPDVVHSHGWSTLTAVHLDLPVVATLHDSGLFCAKRTLLRSDRLCEEGPGLRCVLCARDQYGLAKSAAVYAAMRMDQSSLGDVDRYIAVSSFVRDAHVRFAGIPGDRIEVVPNFFREEALGERATDRPPLGLPERYILFVGYLARFKGAHVLVDAYARLRTDVPLVMIGYPTEQITIDDPRVRVIEGAPHSEVMRAMERAAFVVVPSIVPDSLPTVALEAMSREKAVIGSDIGGLPDVVESERTGYLVPPGDAWSLAAKMTALLDDSSLAERLGRAGRQRLEREFSADVVVPRIEETYRQVAG